MRIGFPGAKYDFADPLALAGCKLQPRRNHEQLSYTGSETSRMINYAEGPIDFLK